MGLRVRSATCRAWSRALEINFPGTDRKGGAAPPSKIPLAFVFLLGLSLALGAYANTAYLCPQHTHPGVGAQEPAGGDPHPSLPLGKVLQSHPRNPSPLPPFSSQVSSRPPCSWRGRRGRRNDHRVLASTCAPQPTARKAPPP